MIWKLYKLFASNYLNLFVFFHPSMGILRKLHFALLLKYLLSGSKVNGTNLPTMYWLDVQTTNVAYITVLINLRIMTK